jgi:hypothetical protein
MRRGTLVEILFIFYCIEVGSFLVLAPWSASWERAIVYLPLSASLLPPLLSPALRGGVTGFGLIHLVWAAHDLDRLLSRLRSRAAAS